VLVRAAACFPSRNPRVLLRHQTLPNTVCWCGPPRALSRRSFPAVAFALSVWFNIGPRAIQHHRWYKSKFDDYPKQRAALVPFLI